MGERGDADIDIQEADSDIGLSADDLAIVAEAERDAEKIVTKPPPRPYQLGYISVFCIIANSMIGTGIFDTPSTNMIGTRSVGFTLIFWFLGGIAAMAGTLCFTEYGMTIPRWELGGQKVFTPRSGGVLNYLNYLLKRPRFLATCLFGIPYILIGSVAANALSFGIHVLNAAGYAEAPENSVRCIAIGTITAICLLHGLWRSMGVAINNIFSFVKILILIMIIIIGLISIGGKVFDEDSPAAVNLDPKESFASAQNAPYGYAQAYLGVVYAFSGFNQANYVLGEIREPTRIFKSATLIAVGTVWVLYMLVNVAYMIVVPAQEQVSGNVAEQFIQRTLGQVSSYGYDHAAEIINACMAISSFGNLIVAIYTDARVKQEIAKEGVLPFSRFLARNYDGVSRIFSRRFRDRASEDIFLDKTPLGALLLQWFFSFLIIAGTWGAKSTDAYNIDSGISAYVIDSFFGICLGLGLLVLRLRSGSNWHLKSSSNRAVSITAAALYVIASIFPVIVLWIPPSKDFATSYPWFLVPAISVCLLSTGVVYWAGFVYILPHVGLNAGKVLEVVRMPFFHYVNGVLVQFAEVVTFEWLIR